MAFTVSPNMNLVIPGVGTEAGPTYASDINASLTLIDQHDHTTGSGVPITPAAININTDLSFNNKNITNVAALTMLAQGSTPANQSIYVSGLDLHYIDGVGNNIRITSGGAVNATASGISSGTATASFVAGVLVVDAAPNTPANIQAASILLGNNVLNSKYLTLSPPNAMVANYSLILPSLPAQTNVMTLDTSGNMGSTTWNAVANNRTRATGTSVGQGDVAKSGSTGTYTTSSTTFTPITNLAVTIVTGGNPVVVTLAPDSTGNVSQLASTGSSSQVEILRDGNLLNYFNLQGLTYFPGSFSIVDFGASAGSHTYQIFVKTSSGGIVFSANYCVLIAYEL